MSNKKISAHQLRAAYLDFFKQKAHTIVPSSLLVPENDPTTLFTTAGMQSIMPYLLGQKHPAGTRITNSQKCFRAQDIEEVGDNRHTTFFEMLGNWSLGDYFKKEQLTWIFEFLTEVIGLDASKLFVTVFSGDKKYQIQKDREAIGIWQELFAKKGIEAKVNSHPERDGVAGDSLAHILLYPAKKNWWSRAGEPDSMPSGEPGGPSSEIFYDFGAEHQFHEKSEFADQPCHVNCDCGRFLEIGNSVFMQYQKTDQGLEELSQKNIDFGGGLERILAVLENQPDVFKTDLFFPIIKKIEELSNKQYEDYLSQFRVIADHLKAAVFLIGDGVKPSNKDQGYLVRRLLRRSIRQERYLSPTTQILPALVPIVVGIYRDQYPELVDNQNSIQLEIEKECIRFGKTLDKGLREFTKLSSTNEKFSGSKAYHLYETYGFPLEVLKEEAKTQKVGVTNNFEKEFLQAKQIHISNSRSSSSEKFKGGLADHSQRTTAYHTATHLIHAALRKVLGEHVQQKGSNISAERLRFDFSHPKALTQEEVKLIQKIVNRWISQDLVVNKITMNKQEALNSGALAFFAERYPDEVSVYLIGSIEKNADAKTQLQNQAVISKELCGGPHVSSLGQIGQLEIFKEKSASSGVRRIYVRVVE